MRINAVSIYTTKSHVNPQKKVLNTQRLEEPVNKPTKSLPAFRGCHFFKVAGFIVGAVTAVALAPGLAAIGLAGVGALPGALAGAAIDEKIDENNEEKDSHNNNNN